MILALGVVIFVIGCCLSSYEDNSYNAERRAEQRHRELMRALDEASRQPHPPAQREFVKRSIEYDHYRKRGTWGKYTVYYVWNKAWEGAKIGYPHFALVDGENIRLANHNETMKIMGL